MTTNAICDIILHTKATTILSALLQPQQTENRKNSFIIAFNKLYDFVNYHPGISSRINIKTNLYRLP